MRNGRARVVKGERGGVAGEPRGVGDESRERPDRTAKTVFSEWVREHARRAEEYRLGYVALLKNRARH